MPDTAVQRVLGKIGIPVPIVSFDGNSNLCGCSPPDPNGAVGPNHVVTMSNLHYQIFNKTGTSLFGPAANNTLWAGFGGGCQTRNAGDPVVLIRQNGRSLVAFAVYCDLRHIWSVWRFRRRAIRWDLITVGLLPSAVEIIFGIIRKLECGPTPIILARASSRRIDIRGGWRLCAGSRAGFGR